MWYYKGEEVTSEMIAGYVGFVYKITRIDTGRAYIGKKSLSSTRKKKLTKKELAENATKPGRKSAHKRVTTESDWQKYYGSDVELKNEVKELGTELFHREIVILCTGKKQMSYYEENLQHQLSVLENPHLYYNKNIGGRYFIKDLLK